MAAVQRTECLDFLQFQDMLKKMRELDDKIIYTINTRLPTESFKGQSDSSAACKELFGSLQENSDKREKAIKNCIDMTKSKVSELKSKRDSNSSDMLVIKELRKEQSKLKLLHTELGVEEVVRDRTSKTLYERCRSHYLPPGFNI